MFIFYLRRKSSSITFLLPVFQLNRAVIFQNRVLFEFATCQNYQSIIGIRVLITTVLKEFYGGDYSPGLIKVRRGAGKTGGIPEGLVW